MARFIKHFKDSSFIMSRVEFSSQRRTHRLIVDEVMQDGRAAVVLLDPADFEGVAFGLKGPFELWRVWIPCSCTRVRNYLQAHAKDAEKSKVVVLSITIITLFIIIEHGK